MQKNNGLVRVTEVVSPWVEGAEYFTDEHRERGTRVHRACAALMKNLWYPSPGNLHGYLMSFQSWFNEMVEEVILIETRLDCVELGFTGQPDLIAKVKSHPGLSIVDWKTSQAKAKIWQLQVSGGYRILAEANKYTPIKDCFTLQLDPDGGMPKVNQYSDIMDEKAFLEALDLWRYFHNE